MTFVLFYKQQERLLTKKKQNFLCLLFFISYFYAKFSNDCLKHYLPENFIKSFCYFLIFFARVHWENFVAFLIFVASINKKKILTGWCDNNCRRSSSCFFMNKLWKFQIIGLMLNQKEICYKRASLRKPSDRN